jgi:hypothetical protein
MHHATAAGVPGHVLEEMETARARWQACSSDTD